MRMHQTRSSTLRYRSPLTRHPFIMRRTLLALALGSALGIASMLLALQSPTPRPKTTPAAEVGIAGLLGGTTLVPLAQYVSGRWIRTWPQPDEQIERKITTVKEIPRNWYPVEGGLPREWYLWTEDLRGVPVRVGGPRIAEAHCQSVWGFSTPLQAFDHETTSLATTIREGIKPFERFTLGAGLDPRNRFLREQFDNAEAAEVRARRPDAKAVLAHRPDFDPVIQLSCVGYGSEDEKLCSFEASRVLGTRPAETDPDCSEVAVVQGWFLESTKGFTALKAYGTLTDCEGVNSRTSTPLLLITADGHTFLLVREHGYEDESFSIVEFHANSLKQVLGITGGGC